MTFVYAIKRMFIYKYRVYFARTMRILKKFKKLPRNAAAISVAAGLLPKRSLPQK